MEQRIVVYGAGGFAREVAWLIEQCREAGQEVVPVGFIDDAPGTQGKMLNGLPVVSRDAAVTAWPGAGIVVAVGDPNTRKLLTGRAVEAGFAPVSLIHPRVERSRWLTVARGSVICAGTILTTNIALAEGVQINLDCTIGHDVVMGEFATLAPGVHVSGCVQIGAGAYIGTGATVINGTPDSPLVIGAHAVVGAGACVTKDVAPGTTVVGIPAKPRG